jgi:glycosyltransferase involved in cell wall biosynthesis
MNICIVTSWFPTNNQPDVAPFVYNFAKNLGRFGVSVSVIAPIRQDKRANLPAIVKKDFMTVYYVNTKFPMFSILKLVNRIKPDIIHVHAPNFFSTNAVIVAKLMKIPIVATVHRAEVDAIGMPVSIFRRCILRSFQHIIAVSYFTQSLVLKAGADQNKISVIYNSSDETIFAISKNKLEARKECNLPIEKKILLFVGNLIRIKGVYTFIESLKILHSMFPDFITIIIGRGEEQEELKLLTNEYGLNDNVKFIGWLPQSALSDYYRAADVFVLPSLTEGHSVALLEAMESGLPIVASNTGGNKESIEDGFNGLLFESGNEKSLAEKLAILLTDYTLQERMSINSSNRYIEKFSTNIQMENHLKVYSSSIDQSKPEDRVEKRCTTILLLDNQNLSHYTSYLACGLSRYKEIVLYGFSKDDYSTTGAVKKEEKIKFCWIGEKLPKKNSLIARVALRPIVLFFILSRALTRTKYDIVHIQGHLPMFFLFLPLLKIRGKQIFWTWHDVNLRPSSKGLRGKLELLYINAITQPYLLTKFVDTIIVHGSSLKKIATTMGVNQEKIYVIPHLDYRYMLPNPNNNGPLTKSDDFSFCKTSILFFGIIRPYKGIDVLINAGRIARRQIGNKFDISIVGEGDSSYFESMLSADDREYIKVRNEWISNSEIPEILGKANFLVLPYTSASQSGVLSLAYTFSKPVIVSNVGSLAEFVEHGETGFIFEAGNSVQLADYIMQLVENNVKCIEMGKKAYQKMLKEMSLDKSCEVLDKLYNNSFERDRR